MKLSEYMESKALDDAAFAALVGCDRSTIFRIRKDQQKPSDPLKAEIAKATGGLVQPNDYFDDLPEAAAA